MRKLLALPIASFASLALLAGPVAAGETTTTFEVTATSGTLSIGVPTGTEASPVHLGSVAAGSLLYETGAGAFGTVRVVDGRALTLGWTATATGTDFVRQGCDAPCLDVNQLVTAASVVYTPGDLTVDLGDALLATGLPGTLAVGGVVSYTGTGSSDVQWAPTFSFTLLETQVAGTYEGTVSHGVS